MMLQKCTRRNIYKRLPRQVTEIKAQCYLVFLFVCFIQESNKYVNIRFTRSRSIFILLFFIQFYDFFTQSLFYYFRYTKIYNICRYIKKKVYIFILMTQEQRVSLLFRHTHLILFSFITCFHYYQSLKIDLYSLFKPIYFLDCKAITYKKNYLIITSIGLIFVVLKMIVDF